ncbi:hypothetical protein HH214_02905 [Mucilaginibacter robiniae]|uniref:Zf-HC2 domain-containing protein n=1 Tax=Mucilaginibacter robiniae TaxID=2728022 RepID=A0A7L5DV13_9SPHI|nr:hypothetical protein [Mucilaginibacter robiniae]QJD94902.1 hypothetical protein HH214_02905 [Mucilaginibacter robiniae]
MNNIEEKLWSYIDGTCTPEEQQAIIRLIEDDEVYRHQYQQLLAFNQELQAIELDEPSMAFTYNVMEAIRTEEAQKPLKAAINPHIIKAIAGFFIVSILALLGIALANMNWSAPGSSLTVPVDLKSLLPVKSYTNGSALRIFLFFDVVLVLFLADGYLRRKANLAR